MFDYFNKPPRSIKQNQGNAGPTHVCKDTCLQRQALLYHPVRARLLKDKCTAIEYAHILPNPFGMYKTKNNFMSPIFQAQEHAQIIYGNLFEHFKDCELVVHGIHDTGA